MLKEAKYDIELYRGADTVITMQISDEDGALIPFAEGTLKANIKRTPSGKALATFDVSYNAEEQAIILLMSAAESMNIAFSTPGMREEFIYDLIYEVDEKVELLCYGTVDVYAGVTYEREN